MTKNKYEVVVDCANLDSFDVVIAVRNSMATEELNAVLPGATAGFYRYATHSETMVGAIEKALAAITAFLAVPSKEDYERNLDE